MLLVRRGQLVSLLGLFGCVLSGFVAQDFKVVVRSEGLLTGGLGGRVSSPSMSRGLSADGLPLVSSRRVVELASLDRGLHGGWGMDGSKGFTSLWEGTLVSAGAEDLGSDHVFLGAGLPDVLSALALNTDVIAVGEVHLDQL